MNHFGWSMLLMSVLLCILLEPTRYVIIKKFYHESALEYQTHLRISLHNLVLCRDRYSPRFNLLEITFTWFLQVFAQPLFGFVEMECKKRWPQSKLISQENLIDLPGCGIFKLNLFRLVWRTVYVILTTLVAMAFPNFNDIVGLLGASTFWPLTVFFPIEMHIAQAKIPKFSCNWIWLQILSFACLIISLLAAAGSIRGLIQDMPTLKPFRSES